MDNTITLCACGCGIAIPEHYVKGRRSCISGHSSYALKKKSAHEQKFPLEKTCLGCKEIKEISEFSMRTKKSKVTGEILKSSHSRCKSCVAERERLRFKRNRKTIMEKRNETRLLNKGNILYWARRRVFTYRYKTPDSDLSINYLVSLFNEQEGLCYYTGNVLTFPDKTGFPSGISLDRLDPSKGYIQGNVVFCSFFVNTMKGALTEEQFYNMLELILLRKRGNDR